MGGKDKARRQSGKAERAKIKKQLAASYDQVGSVERAGLISKLWASFKFDQKN